MTRLKAMLAAGAAAFTLGITCMGASPVTYHPFEPSVEKPGGGEFLTWDTSTKWTRTYYVDGKAPGASDENAGDAEHPFKTINHVAHMLLPGERVIVRPGVYRECVRPARGGRFGEMIGYHADPAGPVVIRGSELPPAKWVRTPDGVWQLDLALLNLSDAENPFLLENLPDNSFAEMPWATPVKGEAIYAQTRGMVFQDGVRLQRMDNLDQVIKTPGSHWTNREKKRLLVSLANGKDPNTANIELTTRQAAFRPAVRGIGFLEVRGFTVEYVGNGFPRPQEGAISANGGHHFLVEGNNVRDINGVGIDIGMGWYGGALHPSEPGLAAPEYTIVRGNRVERTGVVGITGIPAVNALIERNILIDNTIYPITRMYESAGIKTHNNTGTLIRQNLIIRNPDNGIWMDWDNKGSRCTQNIIADCLNGIFVEASVHAPFNEVDRNVIFRATNGICELDSWKQTFVHNLICDAKTGIRLQGVITDRTVGDTPVSAGGHLVANNLILNCAEPVFERKMPNFPDNTIADNATSAKDVKATLDVDKEVLRLSGLEAFAGFCKEARVANDLMDRPWPKENRGPGPLPKSGEYRVGPATGQAKTD